MNRKGITMTFIKEYRGYCVETAGNGVFAWEDDPRGDWFYAEDMAEVETTIDSKRWDQEQDAEWDREHAKAVAAGQRLDDALAAVSDAVGAVK
jgi:hypothetical protein